MCGFRRNESLGTDAMRDYRGYVIIKDYAGSLINQQPVLDVSGISSSDGDDVYVASTRKPTTSII